MRCNLLKERSESYGSSMKSIKFVLIKYYRREQIIYGNEMLCQWQQQRKDINEGTNNYGNIKDRY